jgi:hypothetical protein
VIVQKSTIDPHPEGNYLLGDTICGSFAVGAIGATDDFFLIGAPPFPDTHYPLITGNVLDSDGSLLFRLVRNQLIINPGNCSKISADLVGYEIYDSAKRLIFRVKTFFDEKKEMFVTRMEGNFYDKNKNLVFKSTFGQDHPFDEDPYFECKTKALFGLGGIAQGLSSSEMELARIAIQSNGAIHKIYTGTIQNEKIGLDGALIRNAVFINCEIIINSAEFEIEGMDNKFDHCKIVCIGPAGKIYTLLNPPNNKRK